VSIQGGDSKLAAMSGAQKLNEAAHRALALMPGDVAQQLSGMLSVQSFAIMMTTFGVAMVGEVYGGPFALAADLILLTVGFILIGPQIKEAGEKLCEFYTTAIGAQSDEEMDNAASAFATLVALIGVNALAAILFGKTHKVFKDAFVRPGVRPTARGSTARPTTPGRLFWNPETVRVDFDADLPAETAGDTIVETGQIRINRNLRGSQLAQLRTLAHERVHQLITRLASLSQLTFEMRVWALERSYLFRYLEETLAEYYAGRVVGEPALDAFSFAIKNGYIEARRWAAGLRDIGADRNLQIQMRNARGELRRVNERISEMERLPNEQKFFRRSEIKDLYDRKGDLEANRNPLEDIFKNFIKVSDGQGGWATMRMKSYWDFDPMLAEAGHILGTLSVAGTLYRVLFRIGPRLVSFRTAR
jgi:hypothetical protein